MRASLHASLLAGFVVAPISLSAIAADGQPQTDAPCRHQAIVNGAHIQPGSAEDFCASGREPAETAAGHKTPGAPPFETPKIDADEAYIRDILQRYQNFHLDGVQ